MPEAVPSLQEARDHAWDHWSSDGLYALVTGFATLALGLGALWAKKHLGLSEFLGDLLRLLAVAFLAEEVIAGKVVGWLKTRITYPRVGYVARPQPLASNPDASSLLPEDQEQLRRERSVVSWIWGPLLLFFFGMFIPRGLLFVSVALFAAAFVWMSLLLWARRKSRQLAWYQLSAMAVFALPLAFWPASLGERAAVSAIGVGIFLVFAGTTTLCLFLTKHPARRA
jgi:hypothetical protein